MSILETVFEDAITNIALGYDMIDWIQNEVRSERMIKEVNRYTIMGYPDMDIQAIWELAKCAVKHHEIP